MVEPVSLTVGAVVAALLTAEMSHRDDLKGKAQSVVIAAPRLDQPAAGPRRPGGRTVPNSNPRVGAEPAVAALIDHARHEITDGQHRSPLSP